LKRNVVTARRPYGDEMLRRELPDLGLVHTHGGDAVCAAVFIHRDHRGRLEQPCDASSRSSTRASRARSATTLLYQSKLSGSTHSLSVLLPWESCGRRAAPGRHGGPDANEPWRGCGSFDLETGSAALPGAARQDAGTRETGTLAHLALTAAGSHVARRWAARWAEASFRILSPRFVRPADSSTPRWLALGGSAHAGVRIARIRCANALGPHRCG
jgi:hypothetical protein